jgi:hypothetical protein
VELSGEVAVDITVTLQIIEVGIMVVKVLVTGLAEGVAAC